jgi:hypothetical protein
VNVAIVPLTGVPSVAPESVPCTAMPSATFAVLSTVALAVPGDVSSISTKTSNVPGAAYVWSPETTSCPALPPALTTPAVWALPSPQSIVAVNSGTITLTF